MGRQQNLTHVLMKVPDLLIWRRKFYLIEQILENILMCSKAQSCLALEQTGQHVCSVSCAASARDKGNLFPLHQGEPL